MPFSFVLEEERGRWKGFRRGLSKEDQEAFDRLFDRAKSHTSAAVYMSHPWPLETILLSILLEHEKMLGGILGPPREKSIGNLEGGAFFAGPACQAAKRNLHES